MSVRPAHYDDSLVIVREEDRPWACLAHLLGWVPIWGFLLNLVIWLGFKNRSREVVFHVQQAVQYQIFSLIVVVLWVMVALLGGVLGRLSPATGELITVLNNFLLSLALTAMAGIGVVGGGLVYAGRPFVYPLFGRRVLEGSIRKIKEE